MPYAEGSILLINQQAFNMTETNVLHHIVNHEVEFLICKFAIVYTCKNFNSSLNYVIIRQMIFYVQSELKIVATLLEAWRKRNDGIVNFLLENIMNWKQ